MFYNWDIDQSIGWLTDEALDVRVTLPCRLGSRYVSFEVVHYFDHFLLAAILNIDYVCQVSRITKHRRHVTASHQCACGMFFDCLKIVFIMQVR